VVAREAFRALCERLRTQCVGTGKVWRHVMMLPNRFDALCPILYDPCRKEPAGRRSVLSISPDHLKCVAFICIERQEGAVARKEPIATAFFVGFPFNETIDLSYLVTARHVIEDAGRDMFFIRLNQDGGGIHYLPTRKSDWWLHDTADIAAILYSPSSDVPAIDYRRVPSTGFVDASYRFMQPPFNESGGLAVSLGHELYFPSLFVQHFGEDENLPIVRFGQIARMPSSVKLQRDRNHTIFEQPAYLAECRSWGGHSGSPVFWMYPMTQSQRVTRSDGVRGQVVLHGDHIAFLGLVSAHYDIPTLAETTEELPGRVSTRLNAGISAITPSHFILELFVKART